MKPNEMTKRIMRERFGGDAVIALATVENGKPFVREVDGNYLDGCFYVVTHAKSRKIQQIEKDAAVAISGEWFSGHAAAENLGHIKLEQNREIADRLRAAFASWYDNGHTNEDDPNTVIFIPEN